MFRFQYKPIFPDDKKILVLILSLNQLYFVIFLWLVKKFHSHNTH